MVRRQALDTRMLIQRFSPSIQKRRYCKFGRNRRLVLVLAWDTLFPTIGFFPVIWQPGAMTATPVILKGEALKQKSPTISRVTEFQDRLSPRPLPDLRRTVLKQALAALALAGPVKNRGLYRSPDFGKL